MTINPAIVRNLLRYFAGALVAKGLIGVETADALVLDPAVLEVVTVAAGVLIGSVTEAVYALAKRMGWPT